MEGYTAENYNVRPTLSSKIVFIVTECMYHRILFVVEQWVFLCFLLDCRIWLACQNPRCEIRKGLREIRMLCRMVLSFDSDSPLPILQMVNIRCNIETRITLIDVGLDKSVRLGSFDALTLWDMGLDDRIITSPNMNFIPEFPVIDRSGLFIRADGTWGPHDYTRWPQAYSSKNLHHICIPRLPSMGMLSEAQEEDSLDHHPILYSDLDEEVWERSGEYTLSSGETLITGQYRRDTIETLVRCFHLHKQRAISRYSTTEYKDASDYKLVAILSSLGEKVIELVILW